MHLDKNPGSINDTNTSIVKTYRINRYFNKITCALRVYKILLYLHYSRKSEQKYKNDVIN